MHQGGMTAAAAVDQWRICFRWEEANALDVEIVDYH
jgi:plasmid maintenance system killer protein